MKYALPTQFAKTASRGRFQTPPHISLLQKFILKIITTPGPARGIVMLPIRHGKSMFCSQYLPAWYRCSFPENDLILTGYGAEFSADWGRKSLLAYQTMAPHFNQQPHPKLQRADHWGTKNHAGTMRTTGTHGKIAGMGCHLLISDDQVKDQRDANSPTQRDSDFSWFTNEALSRLYPDGKCIIVMSRRHPDDFIGRLQEIERQGGLPWQVLRMAALCDTQNPNEDPLGRSFGDPLWPQMWSKSALLQTKKQKELEGQEYIWECLYQQDPTGDPSSREWPPDYLSDKIWSNPDQFPELKQIRLSVLALDPSKSKRSSAGDFSAFTHLTLTHDHHLYVRSWLQRVPADQVTAMAVSLLDSIRPNAFIYEDVMMQSLFGDAIMKACKDHNPPVPCPIYTFNSKEDKIVRIRMALTPLLAQKRIHLMNDSPGNKLLLSQLKSFPNASNDDGPDSLTMGCDMMNRLLTPKKPSPTPTRLTTH